MLVITRFPNQGIRVGDDIHITLLGFEKDSFGNWQARIGIDSPRKHILREEMWNKNQLKAAALHEEQQEEKERQGGNR